ncbi:MAG: ribosomal-protein-alanine N-acetyltransferase, partial [Dehalococcoidia bacterium]
GAQRLYEKYGFQKVGVRKRYYTDTGEDALIMTTDALEAPLFREHFERLKEVYFQKHSEPSKE